MKSKLNSLLGRSLLKTSKFKPLVSLAISRVAVLNNKRQAKCSLARSDVLQLLHQGYHERALLRVEHVIKEQNMLDVYDMVETYCNLVIERLHLIENDRVCPDELREAISGMLYTASRCGDFPELTDIRAVLTAHFGKEFALRAVELRNNCGVNHTLIQKLSTRQPSLESRMMVLKEIASENGVVLQLQEAASLSTLENMDPKNQSQPSSSVVTEVDDSNNNDDSEVSGSVKTRRKYRDVADAAQAAFESAAYAADAARAAVELSRSGHDTDHDSPRKLSRRMMPVKMNSESESEESVSVENQSSGLKKSTSSSSSDSSNENDATFKDDENGTLNRREDSIHNFSDEDDSERTGIENTVRLNLEKAPISVRATRLRGF